MFSKGETLRKGVLAIFVSKPFLFAFFLMIPATIILFYVEYHQERERIFESVAGKFQERLNALEHATSEASFQVTLLREWAREYGESGSATEKQPVLKGLQYFPEGDYFELDRSDPSGAGEESGNILGVGPLEGRDEIFKRDLSLAKGLLPLLKAYCDTSEKIRHGYFFSNALLSTSYPYFPVRALIENAAPGGKLKDAFDRFYEPHNGLQLNSARKNYWTDVYLDRTGEGLMVTHAAPLYNGERFVGIIAVDVTLDYLDRFASRLGGPPGRLMFVTDRGKILADSSMKKDGQSEEIVLFGERLPAPMKSQAGEILRGETVEFSRTDGFYFLSQKMQVAPWTFVYLLGEKDFSSYLSRSRVTYVIATFVLSVFLILFYSALGLRSAEKARYETEKKYSTLFSSSNEGIALHEIVRGEGGEPVNYRILDVNPAYESLTGIKRSEAIGGLSTRVYGAEEAPFLDVFAEVAGQGVPATFETEFAPLGKSFRVSAFKAGEDQFATLFADITERKKAEEDLHRLSTAIEQASEDVIITDSDGRILYVNPAFERVTGYSADEAMGETPRILKSGEHSAGFYAELWGSLSAGKAWSGRFTNRKKDGSLILQDGTITPIKNEAGAIKGFVSVKRDVSRQVALENQVVQAQKMEAIGTLAGGIAHDFNNILSAIMGFTELALMDARGDVKVEGSLNNIHRASGRARDLVAQILAFSRQSKEEPKAVQPKIIAGEVLKLLRASLPSHVEIRQSLASDSSVICDATQLHQVLMNLCTNAAHAMREEGGILEVTLKDVELSADFVADRTGMAPGMHLMMTVKDSGCGMTPDVIEKIFYPFFTTKPKGVGTGMGLSVVHGIVESLNGAIEVESAPGKGTEFRVYLPPTHTGAEVTFQGEKAPEGGSERILFVDDEAALGMLATEALGKLGYHVTALSDSEEALALFKRDPQAFDLVITDMTMPRMTGDILAKQMMLIRRDMPVIISTGFSEKIDEEKVRAMGIRALAFKPLLVSEMSRMIRAIFDA